MACFEVEGRTVIWVRAARNGIAYGQVLALAGSRINDDPARVLGHGWRG